MVRRCECYGSDPAGTAPSVWSVREVSTQVGYRVITSYLLELLLCQHMSDHLDSQVRKFCLVKCSSSCLCKQSSALPRSVGFLQIGLICISVPNYLIRLSYFLAWDDSLYEFSSLELHVSFDYKPVNKTTQIYAKQLQARRSIHQQLSTGFYVPKNKDANLHHTSQSVHLNF